MLIKCLPVGHLMTNCYIVTDETTLECAVIDPGDESNTILYYLEDNHLTCRAILLTHGHYDHTGAVYAVHEETGAPVYMNALDAGTAVAFDSYTFTPPEGTIFYKEGDEVKVGNLTFRVMETPGHTPGHLSLFEPQSRLLFGGDHALFVISPSIALFPREGDGLQAYLDSIKRVQDLHISQLFHSHGPIRPDFEQRLDWLAQHHLKRLDEVRGIVARNPRLSGYQIIRAIRWNVPFDDWEDIPIMQRYIMLTQGIVYLKHLVADGSIAAKTYGDGIQLYESAK